jgi:hypothetical protein
MILNAVVFFAIAQAKTEIFELEQLRRETVVTHAVLDHPSGRFAKQCKFADDSIAAVGGALQSRYDVVFKDVPSWELSPHERKQLLKAIKNCRPRGSCDMYKIAVARGLGKNWDKAEQMDLNTELSLASKEPVAYETVIKSVPTPCAVLKSLLK